MRDRLYGMIVDIENELFREYPHYSDMDRIERIADHLLAAGVIVPPCKVGDVVYVVDVCATNIIERKVTGIRQNEWGTIDILSFGFGYPEGLIGKTVFLTKEEAERALAERRANDG